MNIKQVIARAFLVGMAVIVAGAAAGLAAVGVWAWRSFT